MAARRDAPRLQGCVRDRGHGRLPVRLRRHLGRGRGPSFRRCCSTPISATRRSAASWPRHNPAALREIAQRFAEAVERGLWQPRRNSAAALLDELAPTTDSGRKRSHGRGHAGRGRAPRQDGPDQGGQGPALRQQDRREGPAHRPYRHRQGQEHGGLGPGHALPRPRAQAGRGPVRQGPQRARRAAVPRALPRAGHDQGHGPGLHLGDPGPRPGHRRRPRRVRARPS